MAFRTFHLSLHSLQIYIFVAQRQVFIEWRKQSLATSVMIHEIARHNLGGVKASFCLLLWLATHVLIVFLSMCGTEQTYSTLTL